MLRHSLLCIALLTAGLGLVGSAQAQQTEPIDEEDLPSPPSPSCEELGDKWYCNLDCEYIFSQDLCSLDPPLIECTEDGVVIAGLFVGNFDCAGIRDDLLTVCQGVEKPFCDLIESFYQTCVIDVPACYMELVNGCHPCEGLGETIFEGDI